MSNTFKDLPYRVKMMREGILDHDHRNGVCEVQNPLVRSYHKNCPRNYWEEYECDHTTYPFREYVKRVKAQVGVSSWDRDKPVVVRLGFYYYNRYNSDMYYINDECYGGIPEGYSVRTCYETRLEASHTLRRRVHNPEAECALCDNWAAPCSCRMPADCRDWYRCCSGCDWCDSSLRYDRKHGSRHKSKQELKALTGVVAEDYEEYNDSFSR